MIRSKLRQVINDQVTVRIKKRLPMGLINILQEEMSKRYTKYQEAQTIKYSTNQTLLRMIMGSVKAGFNFASLPIIREIHPWVSDKHTHGVYLPINEELTYENIFLPYPIIFEFIEKSSYRMIMNVCGCRQAYGCKNHAPTMGCLNLGESVLDMMPGIGRLVSKEEAREHAQKAIADGLIPAIGKGRIDNFFYGIPDKGKLMGICFCCHCCCITGFFNRLPAEQLNRMFPRIDEITMEVSDDCTACGTCLEYCIYDAITVESGKAVQNDRCRQCGRCVTFCPSKALSIDLKNLDFKDELVQRICSHVDIT